METIMRQFGSLVMELGAVPPYAEWDHRGMRPTQEGLPKVHGFRWTDLPRKFVEWIETNRVTGYERAIEVINASFRTNGIKRENADQIFLNLIRDVNAWTPARRRNSEETYKVELRKHLESLRYELNEEFGESRCDLFIQKKFAIEVKKDPDVAEYGRLFGQVARHLQQGCKVIALIHEATRKDRFDEFAKRVDEFLARDQSSVAVIKK